MQKIILIIIVILLGLINLDAQSLQHFTIEDIDSTNYPTLKASLIAWDSNGEIYYPDANEINMIHGGYKANDINVSCPPIETQSIVQSSIILLIDMSGSMDEVRMNIAKAAANVFVDVISPNSEVAIMAFDDGVHTLQGFTNNKIMLRDAINSITSGGKTNFESALNGYNGAISVLTNGRYSNKSIVFLTDGLADINEQNTITNANNSGVSIYCLNIAQECPPVLERISTRTGGKSYDNIREANQAKLIYMNVLKDVQKFEPCTITWIVDDRAVESNLTVKINDKEIFITDLPQLPPPNAEQIQYDCQYLNWFNYDRTTIKKVSDLRRRNISHNDSVYIYGKVINTSNKIATIEIIDPGNKDIMVRINSYNSSMVKAEKDDILVILGKSSIANIEVKDGWTTDTNVIYNVAPIFICNVSHLKKNSGRYNANRYEDWIKGRGSNKSRFNNWSYEQRKRHIDKSYFYTLTGYIQGKNFSSYLGNIKTCGFYTTKDFSTPGFSSYTDTRILAIPERVFEDYINRGSKIIFNGRIVGYTIDGDNELEDFEVQLENLIYID